MKNELKKAFKTFNQKNTFSPGDIVEWKPGMRHKLSNGPFVVLEVLDTPVFSSENDDGSPYFREPLDLVCGSFYEDGEFIVTHLDSRRMQPVKE